MPDLMIREIPQNELDALAARAARHGRSTEEEARHLLHEAAAEQLLVTELERATRAVEQLAEVEARTTAAAAAASPAAVTERPRRRYRVHEPTPRRG